MGRAGRVPLIRAHHLSRRSYRSIRALVLVLSAWGVIACAARVEADSRSFACGVLATGFLHNDSHDSYDLSALGDGVVAVDVTDVSGSLDLIELRSGSEDNSDQSTCAGSLVTDDHESPIVVEDCIGHDTG